MHLLVDSINIIIIDVFSATFYGPLNEEGYGANLRLLKKCLATVDRSKVKLMVKVGMDTRCPVEKTGTSWIMRGDSKGLRDDVEFALQTLGVDYIDIIVLCRVSPTVPIEESVAALKELVNEKKAIHIGISEASANVIRRAHAVHPIYCIEQEWSLWSRDIEEEILPTCKELNIAIVAYSPLGRGFLTGTIRSRESDALDPTDYRFTMQPKFAEGNFQHNLQLVDKVAKELAVKYNCTAGQLALAWLHKQGEVHNIPVIPIPGTTSIHHFEQNFAARDIQLSTEDYETLNNSFTDVAGDRYMHMQHTTFHANK